MHKNKEEAIRLLNENKKNLISFLKKTIIYNPLHYKTFGTEIELFILPEVVRILRDGGVIQNVNDYKLASNKNEFPDLIVRTDPPLAFELKSGNRSKLDNGIWKSCKNSANDLGTLNMWEKKLSLFNGEDIYYIYIEYHFTDKVQDIIDVKFEHFYKFVGLNKARLLSYREKDGNLRPKDFDAQSPITSFDQFMKLLPPTKKYRSIRLVTKHLEGITDEDIEEVLKNRKNKKI